ncbi:FN3 associated domain-containing protein [Enterococcus sp. 5B7_DIV0075]|uniref:non-contractile tail sheath protein n=2 Tax=Enterococcus TaxID=1350 RepID=UPI000A339EBC|nr:FN3 associated domain-containing protein [Enterococcus sp. 5B7_DIV0075]
MYKLQAKYLTINFNFEMTASVVTQNEHSFSVQGHFRTTDDLAGLIWETEDTHSHESLKYPTNPNFKNVSLSYDYALSGYTEALDSDKASALTIQTVDGKIHYIRLWNYVTNRPEDEWEKQEGIVFPEGRTPGNGTGHLGTIQLDFDNLYEGWSPYTFDANGKWNKNPEWKKIDVTNIKTIMWAFTPIGYTGNGGGTTQYLDDSYPFAMSMTNWKVTGDTFLGNETVAASPGVIRMCDDYDDSYNLTPERIIDSYLQLGYTKIVNFYIGASHYYDKKIVDGTGILLEDKLFNQAFEAWYKDYVRRLADNQMAIIHSISMENVDAKEGWWQRTYDGTPGTSGWTPTPHFLSFTNAEVQAFYQRLAVGLADISNQFGLTPIVQLGEPWWWHQDELTPCFYDQATRNLYKAETGLDMHEFHTVNESIVGHESMLSWLQTKIGSFTLMLRDAVKANYSNAQFTVLFFPPSVMDKTRTPMMMGMVNFPKVEWAYPNLDFFMLEDYDYLIKNQMREHQDVLEFIQNNLGYPSEKIHYFTGFVLDPEKDAHVWKRIHQAIMDGVNVGMGETYIWAYAQVKRDNWLQPKVIYASHKSGNYTQPFNLSFNYTGDKLIYTTNGLNPTLENGTVYSGPIKIDKSVTFKVAQVIGDTISEISQFSYTMYMSKKLKTTISSTGDFSEWVTVKSLAMGSGKIFDLSAAEDSKNLYIYVRGYELDTSSNFYLDTGAGAGMDVWAWPNAKMNRMIQNDKIYRYTGTGSDFSWEEIGQAKIIKKSNFIEVTAKLSDLGIGSPKEIKLGYGRNFEDFAPIPGRNAAVVNTQVTNYENDQNNFIAFVQKVEDLAKEYKPLYLPLHRAHLVADYFRHEVYSGYIWESVAGKIDDNFVALVHSKVPENERYFDYIDPSSDDTIGGAHCFAAIAGYLQHGLPDINGANLGDGCGWLGDLDTFLIDYWNKKDIIESVYNFSYDWIGGTGENAKSFFSREDLISDVDAWNMAYQVLKNERSLASAFTDYLGEPSLYGYRYTNFIATRYGATEDYMLESAKEALLSSAVEHPIIYGFRIGLLTLFGGSDAALGIEQGEESVEAKKDICKAFKDKLLALAKEEM